MRIDTSNMATAVPGHLNWFQTNHNISSGFNNSMDLYANTSDVINTTDDPVIDLESLLGPRRQALHKLIPITLIYCAIFITGIFGNICTCIVIAKNRYMHTATNYYLLNLAISDLILLVMGLPQELYQLWSAYPWVFGQTFCVVRTMASETSTYASILTITAFTVERYVAIVHPMKAQAVSSLPRAIKMIILIWIISSICSIPTVLQFSVVHQYHKGKLIPDSAMCMVKPDVNIKYTFEVSSFLFFFTPMTIITVLYVMIGIAVRRSASLSRSDSDSSTNERDAGTELRSQQQVKGRRAVLKMLVAVVVAFFICWAPFHTQRLIVIYVTTNWSPAFSSAMQVFFLISGTLYFVSSVINPILYNIMSLKFRRAFKNTIFSPCRQDSGRKRAAFIAYKFCRGHVELDSDVSVSRLHQNGNLGSNHCNNGNGFPPRAESRSRSHSSGRANSQIALKNISPEVKSQSHSDTQTNDELTPRTVSTHIKFEKRPYHTYT